MENTSRSVEVLVIDRYLVSSGVNWGVIGSILSLLDLLFDLLNIFPTEARMLGRGRLPEFWTSFSTSGVLVGTVLGLLGVVVLNSWDFFISLDIISEMMGKKLGSLSVLWDPGKSTNWKLINRLTL